MRTHIPILSERIGTGYYPTKEMVPQMDKDNHIAFVCGKTTENGDTYLYSSDPKSNAELFDRIDCPECLSIFVGREQLKVLKKIERFVDMFSKLTIKE